VRTAENSQTAVPIGVQFTGPTYIGKFVGGVDDIGPLADLISQNLWSRLEESNLPPGEYFRQFCLKSELAGREAARSLASELRRMVSGWCDTRFEKDNVQSFLRCATSLHSEMSLRLLRPLNSRIFFDSCVLINWIQKREDIGQGQTPVSQYLISKYLHSGKPMLLLPTVAPEMRMWGETVFNSAKRDHRALEYISRLQHLLSLGTIRQVPGTQALP
jgi:hypothetical protein